MMNPEIVGQPAQKPRTALLALAVLLSILPATAFHAQTFPYSPGGTYSFGGSPCVADIDGDGDNDVVTPTQVWFNDGGGLSFTSGQSVNDSGARVCALGDLDGDGDPDAVFGNKNTPNTVWLNDGTGTFTDSGQDLGTGSTQEVFRNVSLSDLNGDGSLDIILTHNGPGLRTFFNDGAGVFTLSQSFPGARDNGHRLGDIDGDGDLDVAIMEWNSGAKFYLNDGNGNFSAGSTIASILGQASDLDLGDLDGDGDLDFVSGTKVGQSTVWMNDGSGVFTDSGQILNVGRGILLDDFDQDGDLDAMYSGGRIWQNDGSGTFTDSGESIGGGSSVQRLADLDGDGVLDLATDNQAFIHQGLLPPELSVAALIPGAELETVDVDVDLATGGHAIAAATFSIDYDETCLAFDDTDADADNLPDALAFNLPAGFAVTAFHDLGDVDGEIDVSIADLAPPIATLADGSILSITFTSTCSPATDATIIAPVVFSTDPAATFSDDLAVDVVGTTSDGSVEIWPGPRGDCNRTGALSAADLIAEALEIFDDDGTFWADVVGSTYAGSPVGCDANDDAQVDAGDISCTVVLIFGGTCGGSPFADPNRLAFAPAASPVLGFGQAYEGEDGQRWVPVVFSSGSHGISSAAFSIDLANRGLTFDPFDGDGDGLPDSVRFPQGRPDLADVRYDARDHHGELDVTIAEFGDVFADGVLVEIAIESKGLTESLGGSGQVRFAKSPAASFGNSFGEAVAGRAVNPDRGH